MNSEPLSIVELDKTGAGPAIVYGNGPSAANGDPVRLAEILGRSITTIGCNRAPDLPWPIDYLVVGDISVWRHYNQARIATIGEFRIGLHSRVYGDVPMPDYCYRPRSGVEVTGPFLSSNGGSGLAAVNLAYRMGFNPILITGFDFFFASGGLYFASNWDEHSPPQSAECEAYHNKNRETIYARYHKEFCEFIPRMVGVEVINLSRSDITGTKNLGDMPSVGATG